MVQPETEKIIQQIKKLRSGGEIQKLDELIKKIDTENFFNEQLFNKIWIHKKDYYTIKEKLTGIPDIKQSNSNELKHAIIEITNKKYAVACYYAFLIFEQEADKGLDVILDAIKNNKVVVSQKTIKLFENINYAMKSKGHSIDDSLLNLVKNNISNSKSTNNSGFKSTLDEQQIDSLFSQIKDGYIAKKTNPDHFKAIFKDEPLPIDFNKIKWIKAKNLLTYFIDKLFFKSEPNIWKKAKNCFVDSDTLKQSKYVYEGNKSSKPKKSNEIDTILKNIYTHLQ